MNTEIAIPTLLETKEERMEFIREFGIENIVDSNYHDLSDSLVEYFPETSFEEIKEKYKWLLDLDFEIVHSDFQDDNYKRKENSIVYHLIEYDIFFQKNEKFVWNESSFLEYFEVNPVPTGYKYKPYTYVAV